MKRISIEILKEVARIKKNKILEYLRFESKIFSFLLFNFYYLNYLFYKYLSKKNMEIIPLGKIFRHMIDEKYRQISKNILVNNIENQGYVTLGEKIFEICNCRQDTLERLRNSIGNVIDPFDRRLIILSPKKETEKGVIAIKFTENFKYFMRIFDTERLLKDYIIMFEPSFSGYFDEDILCLMALKEPLIIESPEIVDYEFIKDINSNLIPIDLGANSWVDSRVFFEEKNIEKTYDIIMVALWADFKRHYHLFESLSKCKNKKHIKIALVGAPWPKSLEDIKNQAKYYGVYENIHFYENISQNELNSLLNKSKIFLLLSKKEGINKSIIESMHANVPTFILEGFNYGYKYPYINNKTGGFVKANELTKFIDNIHEMLRINDYEPSKWIQAYMSVQKSTEILKKELKNMEKEYKVSINKDIVPKINNPDFEYWDIRERQLLKHEYERLKFYLK